MVKKTANNAEVRLHNNHVVYKRIYNSKYPVTKRELAEDLNLSLPTITSCIEHLIKNALIEFKGLEASTGGRKPRTIKIIPNSRLSLGLTISANNIRFMCIDIMAEIIAYEKIILAFSDTSQYYKKISEMLEKFIESNNINRNSLLGLGISIPGIINNNGIIETAPTLNLKNKDAIEITKYFNYKTILINDANAGGFAEWWHKPADKNLSCLFIEQGIGGATLIDGKPYYGNNQRSCEFGHICIAPNGFSCSCGKQGCLEAMCSTDRLSKDLDISLDDFFKACNNGRSYYSNILDEYLLNLAKGIAIIRVIFDCSIIISGSISQFLLPYMDKLQNLADELSPFENKDKFIKLCQLGAKSSCFGAALIWIEEFIENIY